MEKCQICQRRKSIIKVQGNYWLCLGCYRNLIKYQNKIIQISDDEYIFYSQRTKNIMGVKTDSIKKVLFIMNPEWKTWRKIWLISKNGVKPLFINKKIYETQFYF